MSYLKCVDILRSPPKAISQLWFVKQTFLNIMEDNITIYSLISNTHCHRQIHRVMCLVYDSLISNEAPSSINLS